MHIGALHMRRSFWISHPKFHKSANGFEGIFHGVENFFRLRNPAQEMLFFGFNNNQVSKKGPWIQARLLLLLLWKAFGVIILDVLPNKQKKSNLDKYNLDPRFSLLLSCLIGKQSSTAVHCQMPETHHSTFKCFLTKVISYFLLSWI